MVCASGLSAHPHGHVRVPNEPGCCMTEEGRMVKDKNKLVVWIHWPHGLEKDSAYKLVISFAECNILGLWSVFRYLWCSQYISPSLDSPTVLSKCNCFCLEVVAKF